jgi:multiple sugar transport system permease protein
VSTSSGVTKTDEADAQIDGVAAQSTPAQRGSGPLPTHGRATPWLFLAPYLTLFVVFVVAPIIFGAWISLHRYDYTLPGKPFVGLDN